MIVKFYTINGKRITVKNVGSIYEAKQKLKKLKINIDNLIIRTDTDISDELIA